MNNEIFCVKLNKLTKKLDQAPFKGELGEKIFNNISQEAWQQWLSHQTLLINEYRLSMIDPNARDFIKKEMNEYFFGNGSEIPAGFNKNLDN